MKRIRPFWAVVAAASAAVVVASIVVSIANLNGKWNWGRTDRSTIYSGEISIGSRMQTWNVGFGGLRYYRATDRAETRNAKLPPDFFQFRPLPAWIPLLSLGRFSQEVVLPFWTIGAVALAGCVFASRRAMRVKTGHCAKCGYDLNGLSADAVCPECGARAASGGAGVPPAVASREP